MTKLNTSILRLLLELMDKNKNYNINIKETSSMTMRFDSRQDDRYIIFSVTDVSGDGTGSYILDETTQHLTPENNSRTSHRFVYTSMEDLLGGIQFRLEKIKTTGYY